MRPWVETQDIFWLKLRKYFAGVVMDAVTRVSTPSVDKTQLNSVNTKRLELIKY